MIDPSLATARELLAKQEHEDCFFVLKESWLKEPDNIEIVRLMSELMAAVGKADLSEKLKALGESDRALKSDAESLFDAGFQFIDERQPELAAMLLERCVQLAPEEPTVHYELGFALMSLKRYQEAIAHFVRVLAKSDDFDTRLNLAVSYTCTRKPPMVREMLERMAALTSSEEEEQELAHQRRVHKRLEALASKPSLSARDWLYIHYGSVLLNENRERGTGGKFGQILNDYPQIARTLLVLRGVLEGLGQVFDVVEYYSTLSRPLAQAFADLLSLPSELYGGPKREERALLIMSWASDIIGPHELFTEHQKQRSIFAYGLTWQAPLPVVPELSGYLAEASAMPWAERWRVEKWDDGRPAGIEQVLTEPEGPNESSAKILACAADLEADPETLHQVQELLAYYEDIKDWLVIGNSETFPRRPEYTNEIPL